MEKESIATTKAPQALGPYAQGNLFQGLLFVSGQLGLDPVSGELAAGVEAQARQVMANVGAVLAAAGSDWSKVLKTTIFFRDLGNFQLVNEIYGSYFSGSYPARSAVQVAALPKGAELELEVIAYTG
jgi:2-iminobutanoate/2-iminopropanoate deaminase